MKKIMKNPIEEIDWELLKEQKKTLLNKMIYEEDGKTMDHLNGLINLIDSIQDYAVVYLCIDENKVFDLS
jgi:hypothetical protein